MTHSADDREAVRALVARQKFRSDDRDFAGVSDTWAADARLELRMNDNDLVVVEGRDAIMKMQSEGWARGAHPHVHMITTLEVLDREDGRLGADSYCMLLSSKGDFAVLGYARYKDIVVRQGDMWRFLVRNVHIRAVF